MRIPRLLLIGSVVLLLFVALLFGAGLYLYHHPSHIKPLLERSISKSIRSFTTIEHLSFTLSPMRIEARGIVARGMGGDPDLLVVLPELTADMDYLGPFRHRQLIVENVTVANPSIRAHLGDGFPQFKRDEKPSFLSRVLSWMLTSLLISDIQVNKGSITNGSMFMELHDRELRVQELNAHIAQRGANVSCTMELSWPSEHVRLGPSRVHVTAPGVISLMGPELTGRIRMERASLKSPYLTSEDMALDLDVSYVRPRNEIRLGPSRVQMGALFPHSRTENPVDLTMEAEGSYDLRQKHLHVSHFQCSVPPLASVRGSAKGRFGPDPALDLQIEEGRLVPGDAIPFLPENIQGALPPVVLSGDVTVKGDIHGRIEEQWGWACTLEARLRENGIAFTGDTMLLKSLLSGTIRLSGPLPNLSIHSEITGEQTLLRGDTWDLDPFTLSFTLDGTYPSFQIPSFEALIPQARVSLGNRDAAIGDIHVGVRDGLFHLEEQSLSLPSIQFDSALLKNLSLKASIQGHEIQAEAKGEQVGMMQFLRGMGFIGTDWQTIANDSVETSVARRADGNWSVQSRIQVKELSFQNPPGTFMGDNLAASLTLEAHWKPTQPNVLSTGAMEISTGELLYERFYGNLGNTPFRSSCKAAYHLTDKSLTLSDLQMELEGIARLLAEGVMVQSPMGVRMHLQMPGTPVGALYDVFLLEPFQAESPILGRLDVAGTVGANVELHYRDTQWSAKGHLLWDAGMLALEGGDMGMKGIRLDLPLWLTTGEDNSKDTLHRGHLSVAAVTLPFLLNQPLKLDFQGGPNTLGIEEPTRLQTIGGEVTVGPVSLRIPWKAPVGLQTSITMEALDLSPFLSRLWPHPVEGTLTGELNPVLLKGNELTTTGQIEAQAFGGQIHVDEVGGSGILTPAPVFKLRAELDGLRLGQLTKDTSFGKVQGVLGGYIHDLEIAYGQPQKFDMILETVKAKGVPQRISVKAVDNIAHIGGGQSPFMGMAGGLAALFKDFPYDKMGVHASLENDVFRINGTIHEGGTEYLVKRGGFSGVNVVNQNPDNRIRFKDMVKRIKRVSGSGKGPVIK